MTRTEHTTADVFGLPPDLAAAWRQHFDRIAPEMWDRRGIVPLSLDHAAKAYPDLFEGESWVPRAMACVELARSRGSPVSVQQTEKRKAKSKAQRQARKRNRRH
jgi:hypothetical protein